MDEVERKKYLALQAFYLQVKALLKELEERLARSKEQGDN